MSASKVRLSIANDSPHFQLVRQLYNSYLNEKDINFMINNVRSGLFLKDASVPLPLPELRRYSSRLIPPVQRQMTDQQGIPDPTVKGKWWSEELQTSTGRAFGRTRGRRVWKEMGDVRRNRGFPASLESIKEGGRKKKTRKRKTRRKNKNKRRTRRKNNKKNAKHVKKENKKTYKR